MQSPIMTARLAGRAVKASAQSGYAAFVAFLDRVVFPAIVKFATHPLVIMATILLIIPLVIFAHLTEFVLGGNTYLNVCSASVSSIVLMQGLKQHKENKALHAENARLHTTHAKAMAALHAKIDALTGVITATAPPPDPAPTPRRPKRTLTAAALPAQHSETTSTD